MASNESAARLHELQQDGRCRLHHILSALQPERSANRTSALSFLPLSLHSGHSPTTLFFILSSNALYVACLNDSWRPLFMVFCIETMDKFRNFITVTKSEGFPLRPIIGFSRSSGPRTPAGKVTPSVQTPLQLFTARCVSQSAYYLSLLATLAVLLADI